uniref:Uncharacterized protein n=1 Tax=Aegilops tauschii subsp. strangulata TaxID=200361 RepID=A0A453HBS1_AEGTS
HTQRQDNATRGHYGFRHEAVRHPRPPPLRGSWCSGRSRTPRPRRRAPWCASREATSPATTTP